MVPRRQRMVRERLGAASLRNSAVNGPFTAMIAIPITLEAYGAIKASLSELDNPVPSAAADGLIRVWLDRAVVDRLGRLRAPGESYSDVITRLAEEESDSADW